MAEPFRCAVVLLAAGASARMGRPKQLLPVGEKPLLRLVAETILGASVSPVVVVLGALAAEIAPSLDGLAVRLVTNENWREGMGASLRTGMEAVVGTAPPLDAVIVVLADQPDFDAPHLDRMIALHRETGRTVVASEAGGVLRPPVLFTAEWFSRLLALEGDAGARALLQEQRANVAAVPLSAPADLDTPEDFERFLRRAKQD